METFIGRSLPSVAERSSVLFMLVSGPYSSKYGRAEAVRAADLFCKVKWCISQIFQGRVWFYAAMIEGMLFARVKERQMCCTGETFIRYKWEK